MHLSIDDRKTLQRIFSGKPVKKAYLFGSYARETAIPAISDIDILVELDHSQPIGLEFFVLQNELEDAMKRKVDLVSLEGISRYIQPFIDKDKILIYEQSA